MPSDLVPVRAWLKTFIFRMQLSYDVVVCALIYLEDYFGSSSSSISPAPTLPIEIAFMTCSLLAAKMDNDQFLFRDGRNVSVRIKGCNNFFRNMNPRDFRAIRSSQAKSLQGWKRVVTSEFLASSPFFTHEISVLSALNFNLIIPSGKYRYFLAHLAGLNAQLHARQ